MAKTRSPLGSTFPPPPGASQPLSIFTLRPSARTERPPPSPSVRPRRRYLALGLAAAMLFAGAGAAVPSARGTSEQLVFVSGAPQTKQTPGGEDVRWWRGKLTIEIDESVDELGPGARDAVMMGFGTWLSSGANLPDLRFETRTGAKVSLEPDGRSSVIYAPIEIAGQKQSLAVTISHIDAATGQLVEADLVINQNKPFAVLADEGPSCGGHYDLQNVVTHEAGHFFGLDEDEDEETATMFFKTGKCELKKRDLSVPDITVLAGLYAQPPPEAGADTNGGCAIAAAGAWKRNPSGGGAVFHGTWAIVGALLLFAGPRRACRPDRELRA